MPGGETPGSQQGEGRSQAPDRAKGGILTAADDKQMGYGSISGSVNDTELSIMVPTRTAHRHHFFSADILKHSHFQ